MIKIDLATLFPAMCETVLSESIIGRARKAGRLDIRCFHIRDYTVDRHRNVDDTPYGPGKGMLMQADPMYRTWAAACEARGGRPHVIYMSPQGRTLTQQRARELSQMEHLYIMCGHYEGVDQRVLDEIVDEEISIGDYVLTGGELPAMVLIDAVARMIPEVLGNSEAHREESVYSGLLEYPQYTKPREYRGLEVPEVLLSGNHKMIHLWQLEQSMRLTKERRPDLWQSYLAQADGLSREEKKLLSRVLAEE